MAAAIERPWEEPPRGPEAPLRLYNSLKDEKMEFIPRDGVSSKSLSWYTCGPTVYDSAHMGHARNYVTFDIVRRVLEDYFGYNILFIMNVTDVDDKIILRARRNHLVRAYLAENSDAQKVAKDAEAAVETLLTKQQLKVAKSEQRAVECQKEAERGGVASRRLGELQDQVKQEQLKLTKLQETKQQLAEICSGAAGGDDAVAMVMRVAKDCVAEVLDAEKGASVTDPSIFRDHAAKYEREFMEDMDALGCRRPDVLTRVSEYMPEIVAYVEKIVDNGMAYASNGSVYFDVQAFRQQGHVYGKLKPWAVGSAALAAEGEANFETREKRHPNDFALWKAARPGEPSWESPWGQGRPGWHIECSAMASAITGAKMDIHSGGEDLKFPHHDNELAQAEAHYHHEGCRQWVNYFLHSGHLNIDGLKMSKSLKNFITIREALEEFTPRQVRLLFVLQPWHRPMTFNNASREEMRAKERTLKNFFQNVEVLLREASPQQLGQRWQEAEAGLNDQIEATKAAVHDALLDNINTPLVMEKLLALISAANLYLEQSKASGPQPLILQKTAAFIARILAVFGLSPGLGDHRSFGGENSSAGSSDAAAGKYLDCITAFRDEVRRIAKAKRDTDGALRNDVMKACDWLRDEVLVEVGVRLEDRDDGCSAWKLDEPAVLRAEILEQRRKAAEREVAKEENKARKLQQELEKLSALAAMPPVEEALAEKYSRFDAESGVPTHDKDGNELEGKMLDKARKELEKARKIRKPLTDKLAQDAGYLASLREEVEKAQQRVAELQSSLDASAP